MYYYNDTNLIEYSVNRTLNRKDAWDLEEHEFEDLEDKHNELIYYISENHQS